MKKTASQIADYVLYKLAAELEAPFLSDENRARRHRLVTSPEDLPPPGKKITDEMIEQLSEKTRGAVKEDLAMEPFFGGVGGALGGGAGGALAGMLLNHLASRHGNSPVLPHAARNLGLGGAAFGGLLGGLSGWATKHDVADRSYESMQEALENARRGIPIPYKIDVR